MIKRIPNDHGEFIIHGNLISLRINYDSKRTGIAGKLGVIFIGPANGPLSQVNSKWSINQIFALMHIDNSIAIDIQQTLLLTANILGIAVSDIKSILELLHATYHNTTLDEERPNTDAIGVLGSILQAMAENVDIAGELPYSETFIH